MVWWFINKENADSGESDIPSTTDQVLEALHLTKGDCEFLLLLMKRADRLTEQEVSSLIESVAEELVGYIQDAS